MNLSTYTYKNKFRKENKNKWKRNISNGRKVVSKLNQQQHFPCQNFSTERRRT